MPIKKPNAKDWRNRDISDWTLTTFRQFLYDQHEQRYGIKYVARSYAIEGRWLKLMIAEHGPEVVRAFIEACFEDYHPTEKYPGLNFGFMYTYQRSRILPRVLAEDKRKQAVKQAIDPEVIDDEWL